MCVSLNIHLGTDIVHIPRIGTALERFGERFLQKVYTSVEQQDCLGFHPEFPVSASSLAQLAGRWAAKESVVKALGTGWRGIQYTDVEIRRQVNGAPQICLYRTAADEANQRGGGQWQLSLSHDGDYAIATAIFYSLV